MPRLYQRQKPVPIGRVGSKKSTKTADNKSDQVTDCGRNPFQHLFWIWDTHAEFRLPGKNVSFADFKPSTCPQCPEQEEEASGPRA